MQVLIFVVLVTVFVSQFFGQRAERWKRVGHALVPIIRHVGWDIKEIRDWHRLSAYRVRYALWRHRRELRHL